MSKNNDYFSSNLVMSNDIIKGGFISAGGTYKRDDFLDSPLFYFTNTVCPTGNSIISDCGFRNLDFVDLQTEDE